MASDRIIDNTFVYEYNSKDWREFMTYVKAYRKKQEKGSLLVESRIKF